MIKNKTGFVGIGGYAGNQLLPFYKKKYPCLFINSAHQDLDSLKEVDESDKYHIPGGEGCNKNRKKSKELFRKDIDNIVNAVKEKFPGIEYLFVAAALGGGTGAGGVAALKKIAMEELDLKACGTITVLPDTKTESIQALINSYETLAEISNLGVLKIFKPFGYIGVSLFFFCSGYGVMKKYSLDSRYMDGFLQKRFKGVYLPYIVTTVLWFVVNALLLHETYDLNTAATEVIQSVLLIKTSLPFAWYVLAVLVWYCIFFLTAKIIREPQTMLRCLIVLNVIWYIVGILTGVPSFYYNGTCCIIIGCAVALRIK